MTTLSTEARALLDLTRTSDGPTDAHRRRVAQALAAGIGVAGSSLLGPGSAAAAAGASTAGSAVTGVAGASIIGKALVSGILGLAVGFAVAVPAAVLAPSSTQGAEPPIASAAIVRDRAPQAAPVKAAPRVETPFVVPVSEPQALVARPRASAVETQTSALDREAELLASVQRELSAGRGERALKLLDDHERAGTASVLGPERAAARVLALCQVGEVAAARRLATEFLRSAPNSPVVPRIQRSCAFRQTESKAVFAPMTESRGTGHSSGR